MYQRAIRIIEFIEEERRTRDTFDRIQGLMTSLTGAAYSGRWHEAQHAAQALQKEFSDLEATNQPGFGTRLLPDTDWETRLLTALGFPAETITAIQTKLADPAHEPIWQDVVRAELIDFARNTAGRNELLMDALAAGLSEAETARLSHLARGTVRAVQAKNNSTKPDQTTSAPRSPASTLPTVPQQMPEQPAPTAPAVMFLSPPTS